MPDRARKNHLKEQKRKQKHLARRRAESVSPYRRLASLGQIEACYINSNWQTEGIASIQFIRDTPSGLAMAIFLVDVWCIGLKDAFGWLSLSRSEIERQRDFAGRNIPLTRVDPDIARQLIAGAIRFSREHQFRLPMHLERWLAIAGGCDDVDAADISGFGKDGKLFYVGHPDDLAKRLTNCTLEEFLARPDVQFAFPEEFEALDGDEDEDDKDEEIDYFERYRIFVEDLPPSLAERFRAKLLQRGEAPHPRLEDGIKLVFAKTLSEIGVQAAKGQNDAHSLAARATSSLVAGELLGDSPDVPADLHAAATQAAALLEEMHGQFYPAGSERAESLIDEFNE